MTPPTHSGRRRGGRSGGKPTTPKSNAHVAPLHPTEIPPDIETFRHWNLGEDLQAAIAGMNITNPTPIQRLAIGPVLEGRDVIAKAETGTGKTLAFGAPMMAKIDPARASVLGLVLCPTRELAEQVQKVLAVLGEARGVKTALIVGGEPLEPQVKALKAGAQVVVGTPGRVLDLYRQKFLSFPWTEFAVLDEADVMLEIGFIDDVKQILSYTPDERQTLLFSATFPPEILKFAREYTKDPTEVATASGVKTVDKIAQSWMSVEPSDQPLALIRLIEQSADDDVFLVFCPRRGDVDQLMRRLERMPFPVKALHGGYDQEARFRVMSAFRTGEVKALIATDVASRGLDVAHVTHVVNLGSPQDVTDYTHRIGRTGRAGRSGAAISIVSGKDMHKWKRVLREATWPIPEVEPPGSSRMRRGERDRGGRRERAPMRERSREHARERDEPVRRDPVGHEADVPTRAAPAAPPAQREHAQREPARRERPERAERRIDSAPEAPLPRRERREEGAHRPARRDEAPRRRARADEAPRARDAHASEAPAPSPLARGERERERDSHADGGRGERSRRQRASGALRGTGEPTSDAPRVQRRDEPRAAPSRWPEDRSEERSHAHDVREWTPEASHLGGSPLGAAPAQREGHAGNAPAARRPITRDEVREGRERAPARREQGEPRRAERDEAPARAPRDAEPRTPSDAPRERSHGRTSRPDARRAEHASDAPRRHPRAGDESTRAPRRRDEAGRATRPSDRAERAPRARDERARAPSRSETAPRDGERRERARSERPAEARETREERPRRARTDDAPSRETRRTDRGDAGGFGSGL